MLGFHSLSQTPLSSVSLAGESAIVLLIATVGSMSAGTLNYDAKANLTPSSVSASTIINAFGEVDAQATANLVNILASFSVSDLVENIALANHTPAAVTAAFELDVGYDAEANSYIGDVTAATTTEDVDFDAKSNITISGQQLNGVVEDFASYSGLAHITPVGVIGRFYQNLEDPALDDFDYDAIADQYDTSRTLYLVNYGEIPSYTVHIEEQNNTVYIDSSAYPSTTVYIKS